MGVDSLLDGVQGARPGGTDSPTASVPRALAGRRGTIRVRTGEITAIVRREGSPDPVELGRRVYVDISDDGCGMRNEVLVNAFEPFFTTKDPGDGAGLGLSMVYGTVRNHGGNIEIASEEGAGTGVKLTFPLYEGGAPPKEEYLGSIPPDPESRFDEHVVCGQASKPGCILVVDDEETLRQTTRRFLKSQGYEVLVADTGRKAIKVFERARDRIQVILLDMIMPVMDGFDTFYELKRRSLNAEVILISGFCADDKVEQMVMDGAFGFLQKPVDPHVLSYELYRAQRFHQNKPDPKAVN